MPLQPTDQLLDFLGTVAWGDLGDLTTYRDHRGRRITYLKTYPDRPVSPEAEADRTYFRLTGSLYHALPTEARVLWRVAAARLSLCIAGLGLFTHTIRQPRPLHLATLARQSGLDLLDALNPDASPPAEVHRVPRYPPFNPFLRRPSAMFPDLLLIPIGGHAWSYVWAHADDLPDNEEIATTWYAWGTGAVTYPSIRNRRYRLLRVDAATAPAPGQVLCQLNWSDRPATACHLHTLTVA